MDAYSFVISLCSLVLAAISTILMYRQRVAAFQEKVYDRQATASMELMRALVALHRVVWTLEVKKAKVTLDPQEVLLLHKQYWEFAAQLTAIIVILPGSVVNATRAYTAICRLVLKGEAEECQADKLVQELCSIQTAIRSSLHVEALASRTSKTIGNATADDYESCKAFVQDI